MEMMLCIKVNAVWYFSLSSNSRLIIPVHIHNSEDSVLRSGENEDWYLGKDEVELVRVEQHVWKSEMWKGM